MRKVFTDADFTKASKMYITGGGALYMDLVENFYKEFEGILNVEVVDNPLTLTSIGYCINSAQKNGGDVSSAVGIDIGNSNTVITQYEDVNVESGNLRFK
jgi:actin-like ATPase involved in cell morphogenesis